MMMNYAEAEFLLAEAKERGIGTVPGTAQEHYDAGVRAACKMYIIHDVSFVVSDAAVIPIWVKRTLLIQVHKQRNWKRLEPNCGSANSSIGGTHGVTGDVQVTQHLFQ